MIAPKITNGAERSMLTAAQLLAAHDLPEKVIEVPEWGGSVRLKAISAAQLADVRRRSTVDGELDGLKMDLHWLAEALIEPRLDGDEIETLIGKNHMLLQRFVAEAVSLNQQGQGPAPLRG